MDTEMGTGFIDVAVEMLPMVLTLLPSAYEVIGSDNSPASGVVRLKLKSDLLVGAGNHMTCEVKDAGSTRKVMVLPV